MEKDVLLSWRSSPLWVRVAPFLVFASLTACQGRFGEESRYWIYAFKTLVGVGLVWLVWGRISEMRWRWSWEAAGVGLVVFALWVGLDGLYPPMDRLLREALCPVIKWIGLEGWCATAAEDPQPWNPQAQFGPTLAWGFALTRLLGSSLVVPPLEEVFYRSFVYRYIAESKFEKLPLNYFRWTPLLVTSAIFGLAHYEWLAGILCGLLYQWLVLRKNRLGDAMTAHAITNFLLGLWVIWRGAWHFW